MRAHACSIIDGVESVTWSFYEDNNRQCLKVYFLLIDPKMVPSVSKFLKWAPKFFIAYRV